MNHLLPEGITAMNAEAWDSKHPPGSPYFLEFLPLLKADGGVEGFEPQMSFERFIPLDGCGGDVGSAEAAYVGQLIAHAEGRGRIPVLTSTRSLGRVRGLKRIAPGLHLLLYRNLFQQWCSFTQQALGGNAYFLDRIIDVIRLSRHDPVVDTIQRVFPLDGASIRRPETFAVFALLHLHLYVQAAGAVDLVIDLNRLESEPAHRQTVESVLAGQAVDVTLSDIKNATAYSVCQLGTSRDLQERLKVLGDMVLDRAPDDLGRAFGKTVLSDLIEEYGRHEFYASGIRRTLSDLQQLSATRDHLPQQVATLSAERDELQQRCDEAERISAQRASIHDATLLELDHLRQQLIDAQVECGTLKTERDNAVLDQTRVQLDLDATIGARDRLRIDHDGLLALQQHDRGQSEALQVGYVAQVTRLEAELADRDASIRHLQEDAQAVQATLRAECDQAIATVQLASRERDDAQTLNQTLSHARLAILADNDRHQKQVGRLMTRIGTLEEEIQLLAVGWTAVGQDQAGKTSTKWFTRRKDPEQRAGYWFQRADTARDNQNWSRAARAYQHYLEFRPEDHAIWIQYGHALKEAGALVSAMAAYVESQRLLPIDTDREIHILDLRQRLRIVSPDDTLHPANGESAASGPFLLVTTTLAAWLLDADTGLAYRIHEGSGVYYGITFSEDTLFIACREALVGAERATQNNVILCFDQHLAQRETLTAPWPIRDVHQIFYYDGTLYICSTYDDAVLEYDVALRSWQRWHPFGEPASPDQHHINSIQVDKNGILLAGNAPEGWIAWFGPDRHYRPENRRSIGSGTHNVWREQGKPVVCSSNEGGIRSEDNEFRTVCENGWVRGVARADQNTYIGVSQNLVRDAREHSDCAIVRIGPTGGISRCFAFHNYGMLHDMRVIRTADPTHNGLAFHLTDTAFRHVDAIYQAGADMISL